jgi:hypothetical protein
MRIQRFLHKTNQMNLSFNTKDSQRFISAIERFDAANSEDPTLVPDGVEQLPREVLYSRWLTNWVLRLKPDASEALRLAARAAHLRRWAIARDTYPATRAGYLRWRADLRQFHANEAAAVLSAVGYPNETALHVRRLIDKSGFPEDPESRILEDALCLVFLEHQFAELARKGSEEKVINALRKTWKKMTRAAQQTALTLHYEAPEAALLDKALRSGPDQ